MRTRPPQDLTCCDAPACRAAADPSAPPGHAPPGACPAASTAQAGPERPGAEAPPGAVTRATAPQTSQAPTAPQAPTATPPSWPGAGCGLPAAPEAPYRPGTPPDAGERAPREAAPDAPEWARPGGPGRARAGGLARGVHVVAGLTAVLALAWTAWRGVAQPHVALAYGVLIALGEAARRTPRGAGAGARETAPVGSAGTLAYALLGEVGGEPASHGAAQVVAVVLGATLAGAVGRPPALDRLARRVLNAAFAAVCFQPLHGCAPSPSYPLLLLLLLALTALCDAVLAAALTRSRTGGGPYGPLLREELRALPGVGSAIGAGGVVMALAVAAAGLWALPVFCLPLLVTQLSVHRYEAVCATRRQTIASLARATEIAGYTRPGHARRVATLGRAVGRELGLSGADLTVVEHAALMHDIGQLSLPVPVPAGATEPLPPEERRRIALLGGAVVRRTGVPADVVLVVERQADPYRDQPLTARIVRTVNAYDDLAGDPACGPLRALERLRLATAHDHEPRVVEALAAVLARGGPAPSGP